MTDGKIKGILYYYPAILVLKMIQKCLNGLKNSFLRGILS